MHTYKHHLCFNLEDYVEATLQKYQASGRRIITLICSESGQRNVCVKIRATHKLHLIFKPMKQAM